MIEIRDHKQVRKNRSGWRESTGTGNQNSNGTTHESV